MAWVLGPASSLNIHHSLQRPHSLSSSSYCIYSSGTCHALYSSSNLCTCSYVLTLLPKPPLPWVLLFFFFFVNQWSFYLDWAKGFYCFQESSSDPPLSRLDQMSLKVVLIKPKFTSGLCLCFWVVILFKLSFPTTILAALQGKIPHLLTFSGPPREHSRWSLNVPGTNEWRDS